MSYEPVSSSPSGDDIVSRQAVEKPSSSNCIESYEISGKSHVPFDWHKGPHTLRFGHFEFAATWTWDILLTLIPVCFFALAIASLRLHDEPLSPYGDKVLNLTLLSPTVYPIIFAAVTGRFFKNLARWRLEKQQGIELATLEQIFGSQSLAGAVERLLFVRTQVLVGIAIVLTWGLSPLGGQSAARLLDKGAMSVQKNGTVYYSDPGQQPTEFQGASTVEDIGGMANTIYTASLLASLSQRRSPMDLWDLPKIPRWPPNLEIDFERTINQEDLIAGEESYSSLLGVSIQGLNTIPEQAEYNFTIRTSYFDFDCDQPKSELLVEESAVYFPDIPLNISKMNISRMIDIDGSPRVPSSFAASITFPNLTKIIPNIRNKPVPLNAVPSGYMLYGTLKDPGGGPRPVYTLFNCTLRPVAIETDLHCNSSSSSTRCWPTRQRRTDKIIDSNQNRYIRDLVYGNWVPSAVVLKQWPKAEGSRDYLTMSSTDNYLAGAQYPFSRQNGLNWTTVTVKDFSERLTTIFNTYWEATLDPFNHSTLPIRNQPSSERLHPTLISDSVINSTQVVATTHYDVYQVNRQWVVVLMITTICLEIMAITGLVLQGVIRGPDILGFASSLTRENTYMNLPSGGSALDGPARARALGRLRVHLADIYPRNDLGYIAFKPAHADGQAAEYDEGGGWRGLNTSRRYL